jgi:voltage-gated potassium channel
VVRAGVENPFQRFRLPAILLGFFFLLGTVGYSVIEHWAPFDAFYMTIITISTVGFSEVHPLDTPGRLFTSFLLVGGVGTMLYGFGVFAETLSEGHFLEFRRVRRLQNQVRALRDHFIVCGYGRTGTQVVSEFDKQGHPYVVIDNNPEAIARLRTENRLHIEADAADEEALREAGIEHARALVSAVDSDERAVYVTLIARALSPKLWIVARAGQPASIRRLELAGANQAISPYVMAGHTMAEMAIDRSQDDPRAALQQVAKRKGGPAKPSATS